MALPVSVGCLVLLCGLLLQQCLHRHQVTWLTESSGCLLLGFAFNTLIYLLSGLFSEAAQLSVRRSDALHDAIYYGLLPPIIFEAGFTMKKRQFFANFGTVLLYAVVGTLVCIFATGALLYLLGCTCAQGILAPPEDAQGS